jgi:Fe2+ or Zn2+ uptake regulation protein
MVKIIIIVTINFVKPGDNKRLTLRPSRVYYRRYTPGDLFFNAAHQHYNVTHATEASLHAQNTSLAWTNPSRHEQQKANSAEQTLDTKHQAYYNNYQLRATIIINVSSLDQLCEQFRTQGYRVTPQRRAIVQVLLDDLTHPTAEQVFQRVRGTMPDMSPATVYNTLRELVKMGALQELDLGLGERYYDLDTPDHAHLVCIGCGRVEDVPYDDKALTLAPEHRHGFQIVSCQITFRGYCPACAPGADH